MVCKFCDDTPGYRSVKNVGGTWVVALKNKYNFVTSSSEVHLGTFLGSVNSVYQSRFLPR